ncbi:hypothetical protein H2200_011357 [Cladophialophora chaetospira]|uniref:Quinate dehydrogenase n=1 Tax=Cladophialophora chaetospira TaxID=386627 RepID=A0AA38WZ52_9EURO|nr:hypothetical protein H2200_011357 [Cladophialophora chaetospira]
MSFLEALSIQEVVATFKAPEFAGGLVTMPWKKSIIPFLDHVDGIVSTCGACNHVSVTKGGALHGTNTDWIGIRDAFLGAHTSLSVIAGQVGLIIGAGGASRAAVYALTKLGCQDIYIVNRDAEEVHELVKDVQNYDASSRPNVMHVRTVQQARLLPAPTYIVGTVPDFAPTTTSEIEARDVYVEFLRKEKPEYAVMQDMCYHPLLTRNLLLAKQHGWLVVDGVQVIGHQLRAQWEPWTGQSLSKQDEKVAWEILIESAKSDPTVIPVRGKL